MTTPHHPTELSESERKAIITEHHDALEKALTNWKYNKKNQSAPNEPNLHGDVQAIILKHYDAMVNAVVEMHDTMEKAPIRAHDLVDDDGTNSLKIYDLANRRTGHRQGMRHIMEASELYEELMQSPHIQAYPAAHLVGGHHSIVITLIGSVIGTVKDTAVDLNMHYRVKSAMLYQICDIRANQGNSRT